jgi:hypothetical protein
MRYVEGPEQNFPAGFFFLRDDIMQIKQAFEKHAVLLTEYSSPGELIALRHAMKNYLGSDSGLAAVIRAVVDGSLAPVGYTNRFRGITGYLFRSEELRKYRPVPEVKARPEAFLNFREAASVLGVKSNIVRGLGSTRPAWRCCRLSKRIRQIGTRERSPSFCGNLHINVGSSRGDSASIVVLLRAT